MTEPVAWRWGQKLLYGRLHWTYTKRKTRDTSEPLFDQSAIDEAVAAERERCAKVCEGLEEYFTDSRYDPARFAAAIRNGVE
jgi:hypothetical protein